VISPLVVFKVKVALFVPNTRVTEPVNSSSPISISPDVVEAVIDVALEDSRVTSISGDISIENGILNNCTFVTTSGDVEFDGQLAGDNALETTSGDVSAENINNASITGGDQIRKGAATNAVQILEELLKAND